MRRALLVLLLVSAACKSAPIKKADEAALVEADGRVLSGCYDCLIDARATYERVAVGKARPLVVARLFEVQWLLAMRERELGLDWTASLERARTLAKELPATYDGARVLALVDMELPDDYGWPSVLFGVFRRERQPLLAKLDGELEWLATSPVSLLPRQYLTIALECDHRSRGGPGQARRPPGWKPELPSDPAPLLVFRHAVCGGFDLVALGDLRTRVPRFIETSYFTGRATIGLVQQTGNIVTPREAIVEFYQRFPLSSSATYLRGAFNQQIGDCREALKYYDETIALQKLHQNALLGRTVCLTFLKRQDEAIQAATHMIELTTPNISEAYYWRAWNQHVLKHLPEARADITNAKRLRQAGDILTLAGIIEHDQDDHDPALADLRMARSMSDGKNNCEAAWYLGLVFMKKSEWLTSAAEFINAMDCYGGRQEENEAFRRQMERRELDPEFKARQLANFDAAIAESRSQRYAAAYNAANFYARGGNVDRAKAMLEIAAQDPALAERVAELRKILGGGG